MTKKSLPGAPKQQTTAHRQNDTAQPRASTTNHPTQADWLAALPDLRRTGDQLSGPCPSCGGTDRFRVTASGHAFCRQCAKGGDADGEAIQRLMRDAGFPTLLRAAELNGATDKVRHLPVNGAGTTTEYEIRDTAGKLVAVHGRRDKLIGKDLWWKQPDGTNGLNRRPAKTLPLYRSQHLPDTKATAICIVEGEKAADALAAAVPTLLVLGTVTGASGTPTAKVLQPVIDCGLPVYLWADRDDEGAGHMQRIGKLLGYDCRMIDAPPDHKGADAANWAALPDRPSWESLAAAADDNDVTIQGERFGVHLNSHAVAVLKLGAYDAARTMADLSTRAMFVAGRGWYYRSSETALWTLDAGRVMLGKVQNHPQREQCQRGLRSTAIMGELEGMLDVDGGLLDADDWLAGLPDGAGILDLRTGAVRRSHD